MYESNKRPEKKLVSWLFYSSLDKFEVGSLQDGSAVIVVRKFTSYEMRENSASIKSID
ncbi:hypothetical protein ACI8B_290076 [Acinetobacter proteolyticus]|uniref:Uncharacterized protein n=1 Tax=Acinetobacter proteolyticus TaxID=1776741 RepID=A0A653K8P1_9GAMM|nr:hypothetical protein ACI8B_290076 [Acinetobacter proteolyticus]